MKRRNFLRTSALSTVPVMLNGMKLGAMPFPLALSQGEENDRVLVIIQLNGGNDGLNCVIPIDRSKEVTNRELIENKLHVYSSLEYYKVVYWFVSS